jgi:hypothetical protein
VDKTGIDAHALTDLLRLSMGEFLALLRQGSFPTPFVSPRGRFYWTESSISEWLKLAEVFKDTTGGKKRNPMPV